MGVCHVIYSVSEIHTVDVEKFAGLNIHGFNPTEVFMEVRLHYFGQKRLLFSIIKERCLYSQKNFHGTLDNHEKRKSLAQ